MGKRYLNNRLKRSLSLTGFTLVEILVVVAIIVILASVILYSVIQYVKKGQDATIKGNLAVLVPAGEVWYDKKGGSYAGFCGSDTVINALSRVPSAEGDKGCNETSEGTAWAICAKEFVDDTKAYCVDNKGNQKEIDDSYCDNSITNCCAGDVVNCIP